ncbi:MAG: FctA domain-containing protein, partial [Eggerthellaceae bacterium]|nr:FctA domain-containing protein [Eggerthellaceae bacterium]
MFSGLEKTDFTQRGAHGHVKGAAGVLSKKRYPAFIGAAFAVLLLLVVALPQAYAAIGDAVASRAVDDHTVSGVSPRGTTINLFDYWVTGNPDYDNWDWSDLLEGQRNSGINSGHTLKFGKGMGNDPDNNNDLDDDSQNDHDSSVYVAEIDNVNKWTHSGNPRTNIVQAQLQGGYPVLSDTLGGESLAYLFDTDSGTGKQAYSDVDGLLQVDDQGYYYYNSQDNFAEFNADEQGSGEFSLYETWGVQAAGRSPDGQFFPFNSGNDVFSTTGYGQDEKLTQNNDINSTTNDENVRINHYFGMSMSTRFVQQYDGYTAPEDTEGRQQVTYNFSGDDDVWIYIDGVLVGDLGGIHDATSIQINFATGDVIVYDDSTFRNSDFTPNSDPRNGNNQYDEGERVFKQTTLGELFGLEDKTFANDTYHTLDFFYLERGNTDSNMSLKYNLVNIPESGVVKVDQSGDELVGVQFTLSEANSDYEADDNNNDGVVTEVFGRTDSNGEMIFTYENSSGQEMPITLEQMGDRSGYWILQETEGNETIGYRNPGTVELRFSTINNDGTGDGVLLSSNQWETGAYSQAHVTATAPTNVTDMENGTHASADGLMFAVVAQIDGQGNYHPVTGDAFAGWSVADATINEASTSKDAIVTAAKASGYQFLLGSGGAYQVTIDDLPGDINTYEYMIEQAGGTEGAQYAVKYYWSNATSINDLSSNSQIVEIDPNAGDSFERIFSVTLSIPNIKNELSLVKTDETTSDPIASVEFNMYEDENGDGTYNEGERLCFTGTTDDDGRLEITSNINNGEQVLAKGEYVLVETVPSGYVDEQTSVRVIVDDDGVHVNAGSDTDNISVETGIGSLVYSMRGFAAGDDVDSTLHDVVAQAQTTGFYEGSSTVWDNADADKTHYQYDDQTDGLNYVRNESVTDNGDATFTANAGWSRLDLRQCMEHAGEVPIGNKQELGDQSLNALFTGDVTIHVTNSRIPTDATLSGAENLQVTKNLVGTEWGTDWSFSFTIAPYGEATEQAVEDDVVSMLNPTEISIGSDNVNGDGVHQAAFGNITFKEAGTYQFVVTENDLAEGIEGVTKDESQKIVTVEVTKGDNGLVATLVDEQSDDLTFTNTADLTINGASALQVTKNLYASADTADLVQADAETYNFTVTAQDTEGEGQPTAVEAAAKLGLTGGDSDGVIDTTLEFSNDNVLTKGTDSYVWSDIMSPLPSLTFTAADRGKTFTNVVDEVEPGSVPAGYVFDASTHTVTYTVSDDTAKALSVVVSVDGNQVNTNATPSVTFDNRIQAGTIGGDGANTTLTVQKTTNVDTDVDFSFNLTLVSSDGTAIKSDYVYELDQDGNPVSFDGMSTSIASAFDGNNNRKQTATFGQIIFTQPGTYKFQVSEDVPENTNGWTYADPQTITVTVNEDYAVSVNSENATVTFENTYGATGSLTLDGLTKALEGRNWIEGDEFAFTLSGKNVTEGADAISGFTLPE